MQRVEEPMETIHLYVVREEAKRPYSLLPLFFAFLCLVAIGALTIYSGDHPYLEHETLRVPPILLPIQNFSISEPVIPTGVKTHPATFAHGVLTLTNGTIITQILPQGMIFTGNNDTEIITDTPVPVPPGNAQDSVTQLFSHIQSFPEAKGISQPSPLIRSMAHPYLSVIFLYLRADRMRIRSRM